jgi:hypothetical protein
MSNTTRFTGGFLIGSDSRIAATALPEVSKRLGPQYEVQVHIYDHDYEAAVPVIYMSKDAAGRLLNALADALAPQPAQVKP